MITGRIADRLIQQYGKQSVFMDIDNIPFGLDFRTHIQRALSDSDVMIEVIGPKWLGSQKRGHARIKEDADPVRIEIETALQKGIPIIPVLVDNAMMPKIADLPDTLKDIIYLNAAPIDGGRDFHQHMDRLIRSMEENLGLNFKSRGGPQGLPIALMDKAQERGATKADSLATAAQPQLPAMSALKAFVFSYASLLLTHYITVVKFDLQLIYLRLGAILLPMIFGLLCHESKKKTLSGRLLLGFAIGLTAVATMQTIVSQLDRIPVLPDNVDSWRELAYFSSSIAFGFWTGVILRHLLNINLRTIQSFVRWIMGFSSLAYWILGAAAATISILTGFKVFLK